MPEKCSEAESFLGVLGLNMPKRTPRSAVCLYPKGPKIEKKFQDRPKNRFQGAILARFLKCKNSLQVLMNHSVQEFRRFLGKDIPAHKNKIGTSPPNPTPPPKRGILWTWRFSCRKNAEILGAHKIGAAISGLRIADKNITDTRFFFFFSDSLAKIL